MVFLSLPVYTTNARIRVLQNAVITVYSCKYGRKRQLCAVVRCLHGAFVLFLEQEALLITVTVKRFEDHPPVNFFLQQGTPNYFFILSMSKS